MSNLKYKFAKTYNLIWPGAIDATKPHDLLGFGPWMSPNPINSNWAELSHGLSFGSSSKHAKIGTESFGIVVSRFVGTVPDILGFVWPRLKPKSGSKSRKPGRILKSCPGSFSSAERNASAIRVRERGLRSHPGILRSNLGAVPWLMVISVRDTA